MFLVGSKGKHNIDTIFEIPISSLNKNAKYSVSHNFNAIKHNELATQTTLQVLRGKYKTFISVLHQTCNLCRDST